MVEANTSAPLSPPSMAVARCLVALEKRSPSRDMVVAVTTRMSTVAGGRKGMEKRAMDAGIRS
jgi:hypothetical protein